MRLPTVLSTLLLCLLIVPTVQAQMQSLNERNSGWENRAVIGLPDDDDEGDDEADDEGCDCPPYPAPVAATGQTTCWGIDPIMGGWAPTDCAGTGQDGEYQTGVPLPTRRFTDNDDGTVTDEMTGLVWLKRPDCQYGAWPNMLSHVNQLAEGECGLTDGSTPGDWRMPNIRELLSLLDYGQSSWHLLPAGHPFQGLGQHICYWSSTSRELLPEWARCMRVTGRVDWSDKIYGQYVWPVRGPE